MTTNLYTHLFVIGLIAPVAGLLPGTMSPRAQGLTPLDSAALQACFDPSLGSLRAGRVDEPAPFRVQERSELRDAQQQSVALASLRAGFQPSDNEWKWLAIGAAVVLLIILI